MTALTEFLLARIAEDETVARSAALPPWKHEGYAVANHTLIVETDDVEDAEHIARWDPTRVLAECEAKRRIIERETSARIQHKNVPWASMEGGSDFFRLLDASGTAIAHDERAHRMFEKHSDPITDTPTLRILAQVWADHPDFDPSWTA